MAGRDARPALRRLPRAVAVEHHRPARLLVGGVGVLRSRDGQRLRRGAGRRHDARRVMVPRRADQLRRAVPGPGHGRAPGTGRRGRGRHANGAVLGGTAPSGRHGGRGVAPHGRAAGRLRRRLPPQPAAGGDRAAGRRLRRGRVDVLLARLRHTERPRPAAPGPAHGPGGRGRVPLGRQEVRQTRGGRRDSGRTAYAASSPGRGAPVRHRRPDVGDGPAGRRPALLVDAAVSRGAAGLRRCAVRPPAVDPVVLRDHRRAKGHRPGPRRHHRRTAQGARSRRRPAAGGPLPVRHLHQLDGVELPGRRPAPGLHGHPLRRQPDPPRRRRRLAGRRAHRRHRGRRRRGLPHRRARTPTPGPPRTSI